MPRFLSFAGENGYENLGGGGAEEGIRVSRKAKKNPLSRLAVKTSGERGGRRRAEGLKRRARGTKFHLGSSRG